MRLVFLWTAIASIAVGGWCALRRPTTPSDPCDATPGPRRLVRADDPGPVARSVARLTLYPPDTVMVPHPDFNCDLKQHSCAVRTLHTTRKEQFDLCEGSKAYDQAFGKEGVLGARGCSAVAVGPRHLLTIDHCVGKISRDENENRLIAVFDYVARPRGNATPRRFPTFVVVDRHPKWTPKDRERELAPERSGNGACSEVICNNPITPDLPDPLVLLTLDAEHDRTPIDCGPPTSGEDVHSFGFPGGLPMVDAGPGAITGWDRKRLTATLTHENGNSGGPLIAGLHTSTPRIVGIASGSGGHFTACRTGPQGSCSDTLICKTPPCNHVEAAPLPPGLCNWIKDGTNK